MLSSLCAAHPVAADRHRRMIAVTDSLSWDDPAQEAAWENQMKANDEEFAILDHIVSWRPATTSEADLKVLFLLNWSKEYFTSSLDRHAFELLLLSTVPPVDKLNNGDN
jgi:hypothetical protein